MPQMSPLFWMYLFLFISFNNLLVMMILHTIFTKFPSNLKLNKKLFKKFYFKW